MDPINGICILVALCGVAYVVFANIDERHVRQQLRDRLTIISDQAKTIASLREQIADLRHQRDQAYTAIHEDLPVELIEDAICQVCEN